MNIYQYYVPDGTEEQRRNRPKKLHNRTRILLSTLWNGYISVIQGFEGCDTFSSTLPACPVRDKISVENEILMN
ncbi:MAG: hypothetical protein M0Q51_10750 [Bacteroidales bacterium]|nr:hypothetical protein [Bacteroidales bacterium]